KLAGSKIENIRIVDGDVVSLPNIPHSPLFLPSHVGQKKVGVVRSSLQEKFPGLCISAVPLFIQQCDENIFTDCDIILCAPDNDETRIWVNYYAVKYNKPVVFLGLGNVGDEWRGYVYAVMPFVTGCFACLFDGGKPRTRLSYEYIPISVDLDTERHSSGD